MTIIELKIACYLYKKFTDDDKKYKRLCELKELNLIQRDHAVELIKWLRAWGCRQFMNENTEMSLQNIMNWYSLDSINLPSFESHLIHNNDNFLNKSAEIFDRLSSTKISERQHNNRKIDVSIGPVGAAKILFAICPNFYSPWDKTICKEKNYQLNGNSYVRYLYDIKKTLNVLQTECEQKGFIINDLPNKINRPNSTLPKIIDEYNWVTITRKCNPFEILELSKL